MTGAPERPQVAFHRHLGVLFAVVLPVIALVVATATDAHAWDDAVPTLIGTAIGIGTVTAISGGPGASVIRAVDGFLDPEEVDVRKPSSRGDVVAVVVYVVVAVIMVVWLDDLVHFGLVTLLFGLAFLLDARAVRRWERRENARIAWRRRSRREALRHPIRSSRGVGIRNPQSIRGTKDTRQVADGPAGPPPER